LKLGEKKNQQRYEFGDDKVMVPELWERGESEDEAAGVRGRRERNRQDFRHGEQTGRGGRASRHESMQKIFKKQDHMTATSRDITNARDEQHFPDDIPTRILLGWTEGGFARKKKITRTSQTSFDARKLLAPFRHNSIYFNGGMQIRRIDWTDGTE
jgi:hypothetical protein